LKPIAEILAALDGAPHYLARAKYRQAWIDAGVYTNLTLSEAVKAGVDANPDIKVVYGSLEHPWEGTIGELYAESLEVAAGLRRLGVTEGEAIVLQIPNWRQGVVAMLAAFHLGLIVVPLIHTYGPAELGYILGETQATTLVIPDRWKKIDYAARVSALGETPFLKRIIVIGDGPVPGPVVRWDTLYGAETRQSPPLKASPDDACLINFTSGTTAAPKGVVHSHHTLGAEVPRFPNAPSPAGRPRLQPLPGGHIAAVIANLQPFLALDPAVLMDQWQEDLALALMRQHRPDRIGCMPFQTAFLLDHAAELFPEGLVQVGLGAASIPAALVRRAESLGCPGTRSYGLTEHPSISGARPSDPMDKRFLTDGQPLEGVQIRLVDEDNRVVAAGEQGEIVSMGPELCKGYLDPALNAAAFDPDGWFHTGDIGVQDADGFLRIVDRRKDVIIRGGENISSKEVEDILAQHPAVAESAAVAWPDQRYGERVGVFVRLNPGHGFSIDDVRAHFKAVGVSIQKTPEHLVIIDDFPRTPAGKIVKPQLRQRVAAMLQSVAPKVDA
jgi:acyl-CoA synthetase (AMP-forming)/AMP-acid ligase II